MIRIGDPKIFLSPFLLNNLLMLLFSIMFLILYGHQDFMIMKRMFILKIMILLIFCQEYLISAVVTSEIIPNYCILMIVESMDMTWTLRMISHLLMSSFSQRFDTILIFFLITIKTNCVFMYNRDSVGLLVLYSQTI